MWSMPLTFVPRDAKRRRVLTGDCIGILDGAARKIDDVLLRMLRDGFIEPEKLVDAKVLQPSGRQSQSMDSFSTCRSENLAKRSMGPLSVLSRNRTFFPRTCARPVSLNGG